MTARTRYPLEPLANKLAIPLHVEGEDSRATQLRGLTAVAARCQVSHKAAEHALARGLSDKQADQWAINAGMHPCAIWPDWWNHVTTDETDSYYADDPPMGAHRLAVAS